MSVTSGFFDSFGGDRLYNAKQISEIFDGVVADGIISGIGDTFYVTTTGGMNVSVGTGRAWFNHTWTKNDSGYTLTFDTAEPILDRIDTVVLRVDHETRLNSFVIRKGTPSLTPVAPTLTQLYPVFEYGLANAFVGHGVSALGQMNITNLVGTSGTPFATSILQQVDISTLLTQWDDEFHEWFETIAGLLTGDLATALQNQIFEIVGAVMTPPFPTTLTFLQAHNHSTGTESQITSDGISDEAVTTPKIGALQVTSSRLANAAVTETKIAPSAIVSEHIASSVAGVGLGGGDGQPLKVNVDSATIEIVGDILRVKDGGITALKIANRSRSLWIPYSEMHAVGLSYLTDGGPTNYKWGGALEYLENDNYALANIIIPQDCVQNTSATVKLYWYRKTGIEQTNSWIFPYKICQAGTLYNSTASAYLSANLMAETAEALAIGTLGNILALYPGRMLSFGLRRDHANVNDDPGTCGVIGVEIVYTADM